MHLLKGGYKMKNEPEYNLGQVVEIRALKINMDIIITKRIAVSDYDNGDIEFYYDFKHNMNIKDAWSWDRVSEKSLYEMIRKAKHHGEVIS